MTCSICAGAPDWCSEPTVGVHTVGELSARDRDLLGKLALWPWLDVSGDPGRDHEFRRLRRRGFVERCWPDDRSLRSFDAVWRLTDTGRDALAGEGER